MTRRMQGCLGIRAKTAHSRCLINSHGGTGERFWKSSEPLRGSGDCWTQRRPGPRLRLPQHFTLRTGPAPRQDGACGERPHIAGPSVGRFRGSQWDSVPSCQSSAPHPNAPSWLPLPSPSHLPHTSLMLPGVTSQVSHLSQVPAAPTQGA